MSTHDHGGHTEPPAPPERIERAFTVHLAVSVDRASWAAAYGEPAEDDFAEYVGNLLRTGLRGLIPSMDHHDGRMQITVRP
jgi:hypothetical protein